MDQRHLAGVGNIYANEALFAAGIDPSKPAQPADARRTARLHAEIRRILRPRSRRRAPRSETIGPAPGSGATFSSSCWCTAVRASPAAVCGTRLAGTHAIDGAITVFCHRCQRERSRRAQRVAPLPSTDLEQLRQAGAGAGREPPGRLPDVRRHRAGPLCRQGQAAPDPAALLFPGRLPGRQGGPDSLRRQRHPLGLRAQRVRRLSAASCGRSGSSVPTSITGPTAPGARCSSRSPADPPRESMAAVPVAREDARCYGPFQSWPGPLEAVRTLNDLLGLRDCAASMPMVFAGPGRPLRPAAPGGLHAARSSDSAAAPAPGLSPSGTIGRRVDTAIAFLEGRTLQPIDQVVAAMQEAADAGHSSWQRVGGASSSSSSGCWPRPAGPAPPSTCSPSSIATPATTETIGCTSCGGASSGLRSPSPPPPSSMRRSGRWSRRGRAAEHAEQTTAARLDRRNPADDGLVPGAPRCAPANDALLRVDQPVGV